MITAHAVAYISKVLDENMRNYIRQIEELSPTPQNEEEEAIRRAKLLDMQQMANYVMYVMRIQEKLARQQDDTVHNRQAVQAARNIVGDSFLEMSDQEVIDTIRARGFAYDEMNFGWYR